MDAKLRVFCALFVILWSPSGIAGKDVCSEEDKDWDASHGKDFNELKFTQIWGHSECLQYKEQHEHQPQKCRYEDQPSIFTIHGIWPTQTGTSGPNCCEKVTYDETLLESIRPRLELHWYEISATKDPNEFWAHEWIKHGSCAKILPVFSTQLKYFSGALDLRKKYDLYSVLKDRKIAPQNHDGKGYLTSDVVKALREGLGVSPYVQCLHKKNGEVHLLAIEICLDRNLSLIDCSTHDTRHLDLEGVLPCPPNHQINFQDSIPLMKEEL